MRALLLSVVGLCLFTYIYSPILSHKMDVPVIHFLHDNMLLQQQPGVGCLVLRVNVDVIEMKTILFV